MTEAVSLPTIRRLRISATLSAYVARLFTVWFLGFFASLCGITLIVSLVDLLDRVASKDAGLGLVIKMALLKLPYLGLELMPFAVLFAAMGTFWRLNRTHELVVTRAAGISVWQFLLPILSAGIAIGVLAITIINPLGSSLLARFDQLEAEHIDRNVSSLVVSQGGLWLRQADEIGQSVIHARRVSDESLRLHDVIIFRFAEEDRFVERLDAQQAQLTSGNWVLMDAWISRPGEQSQFEEETLVATTLTQGKILESFAAPESVSFWQLPGFIALLEDAGFSALPHKLQLNRLLAVPILYAAMILLAASFSLRPQRRGRVGLLILGGVITGFLLYFVSNFVFALGLFGNHSGRPCRLDSSGRQPHDRRCRLAPFGRWLDTMFRGGKKKKTRLWIGASLLVLALHCQTPAAVAQDLPTDELPALLSADQVTYDDKLGIVTASGNVEISQGDRVLLADTVSYNMNTKVVSASGNITLLEPSGEVVFATYAELTDELREGFIRDVRLLLTDDSRLAANSAQRVSGNVSRLRKAVYSPCHLCADDPSAAPLWQIKASQVVHDQEEQVIKYQNAFLEFYGVPIAYTPYFEHPDPTVERQERLSCADDRLFQLSRAHSANTLLLHFRSRPGLDLFADLHRRAGCRPCR